MPTSSSQLFTSRARASLTGSQTRFLGSYGGRNACRDREGLLSCHRPRQDRRGSLCVVVGAGLLLGCAAS
jgi:hypothetical protein